MAFDIGIDFRQTSGYVTDPAGCTYCLAENYPVTRAGFTFGWVSPIGTNARNRSTTVDPRLAGVCYQWGGDTTKKLFRIDLPSAGDIMFYCAIGDATSGNNGYLEVFDDTTSLGVLVTNKVVTPVGTFYDATNVARSSANWPSQNVGVALTMTTTTLILAITPGDSTAANFAISHFRVASAGAAPINLTAASLEQNNLFSVGGITQIQQLGAANLGQVNHLSAGAITVSSGSVNLIASPMRQVNGLSNADTHEVRNNALNTKKIIGS